MAKGNMFQGMARGSVGDVVFYRMDNKQISRVRNRYPRNPRSNKQLVQRAIMATVMRAYSAGKEIFDHSFEGKPVGMGNMREFLSRNADALRQALAYDFQLKPTAHLDAIVNAPKTNTPVPNLYIVSTGSLQQDYITIKDASALNAQGTITTPAANADETLAQYAKRIGLNVGDIYTFVGYTVNPSKTVFSVENGIGAGAYQENGSFFFVRLIVTDAILAEDPAEDALMSSIFEVDATANVDNAPLLEYKVAGLNASLASLFDFTNDGEIAVAMGVIRSEVNSGLRSNETLHWVNWSNVYGIDWQNLLKAWEKNGTAIGDSDLILEGGGENNSPSAEPGPAGITAEGNFLAATDGIGNRYILTSGGQAILLSSGKLQVESANPSSGTATFKNLGSYAGALPTMPATIKIEDGEDAPFGPEGNWVLQFDGKTFETGTKYYNASLGISQNWVDIPLNDFQLQ